jgi:spermidine/putrescine transport system permease protein
MTVSETPPTPPPGTPPAPQPGPPILEREATAPVTPELEQAAERAESRRGFLISLPSFIYLTLLFVLPLVLVFVYSFATRDATGQTVLADWNLESYKRLFSAEVLEIFLRSFFLAVATTAICLVIAYPFAFYIATRRPGVRNVLLVLVMIPFWSNFLVRTYAWRVILGSEGPLSQLSQALGGEPYRLLFTTAAVLIGLVYGFMPFMVLPLYAALERMDWRLVEAARDLYADGWTAFRKVTLPLSMPGVVAGSILVFIPTLGAYVTPALLGGAKTVMMGDYIVSQFLAARNWPFGSALSFAVMFVMLVATIFYFRVGARTL